MEINVKTLREALELLEPAVNMKRTLEALRFIRLGDGQAIATDLELAVTVRVPEAAGEPVLLPIKQALDFLTYTPGQETAHIELTKGTVTIKANSTETQYKVPDAQDFPPIPTVKAEGEGVLDGDTLLRALKAVCPYTATDDTRPVLTAICLTPGEEVEVAAADGFRLAWEPVMGKLSGEKPLLIPSRAVHILGHLWKRCARPEMADIADPARLAAAKRLIRLEWGNGQLQMNFGEVRFLVQLVQGDYPKYRSLIPTEAGPSFTLMAEDMERALCQLRGMAKDGGEAVRLVWEGNKLTLSSAADELGATQVEVRVICSAPGRIAARYPNLHDYFTGRTGSVTISTQSPSAPMLFAYRGTPHVVMMPMFVQWGDEAPPTDPDSGTAEETEEGNGDPVAVATPGEEPTPTPEPAKARGRRKKKE